MMQILQKSALWKCLKENLMSQYDFHGQIQNLNYLKKRFLDRLYELEIYHKPS